VSCDAIPLTNTIVIVAMLVVFALLAWRMPAIIRAIEGEDE
jgi:hypothetical protein